MAISLSLAIFFLLHILERGTSRSQSPRLNFQRVYVFQFFLQALKYLLTSPPASGDVCGLATLEGLSPPPPVPSPH